ncbi:MAG: tRNA (N(6)-L-threonylcarbamoyladenosine(37)-C(2))-methylthiotransferase MtaB, partial [Acidobacteriota bacterium]|nr:tRNA (N(6)-L-threonylcarbamoyladenosine(37)-C(2))-methylthiotransferase MtaB [Acidobacteriota bacterium]
MNRGFHTITLGCKLNQFDTAAIEAELTRRGIEAVRDPRCASVVIINTCTVTGRADAEARKLIRQVRRRNPGCRLLVTGCYAELDPETIRAIVGVDRVFGNRDKASVAAILDDLGVGRSDRSAPSPYTSAVDLGDRGCDAALEIPRAVHFGDRSRAFLKVQEGCNLRCSYCIIPRVRGESRSVPPGRVETAVLRLVEAGYREIVLTGVNTGDYGRDLVPRTNLAALLGRLLGVSHAHRIRLNSLEPLTVSDEIIDLLASEPRLAPHLQVPLQSGSEAVLRRMRRNYRLSDYHDRLERLRARIPGIGLGADVIIGFPGETDRQFEETYRFIAGSPLNYLHVFAWSPRPGTAATTLPDRVHGA